MKKLFNSKTAKGLVSLITIIVLLSSILATSIFYQNNITANAVKEAQSGSELANVPIKEANGIGDLRQLNEGWYEIRNGYVFYLDTLNSYAPLYIKVKGLEQRNLLLAVDKEGDIEFYERENENKKRGSQNRQIATETDASPRGVGVRTSMSGVPLLGAQTQNQQTPKNQITGRAVGMERVTGFDVLVYDKIDDFVSGISNYKKNDDTKTFKFGGIEYTIEKNQAFDTGNSRVLRIRAKEPEAKKEAPLSTPSEKMEEKEKELTAFATLKGKAIYVTEDQDSKKIKIKSIDAYEDGQSFEMENEYSSALLKDVRWSDWDGNEYNLPMKGGGVGELDTTNKNKLKIEYKSGHKITRTETRQYDENTNTFTKTEIFDADKTNQQKIEKVTYPDGLTIERDSGKGNFKDAKITEPKKETVTAKTKDGREFQTNGKVYEQLKVVYSDEAMLKQALKLAAEEEFGSKAEVKGNDLVDGSISIQRDAFSGKNYIKLFEGGKLKKEQHIEQNKLIETEFEGESSIDHTTGKPFLTSGISSFKIFEISPDGKKTITNSKSRDNQKEISADYKGDGVIETLTITKLSDSSTKTFTNIQQVTDRENKFYGKYEFKDGGDILYFDPGLVYDTVYKDGNPIDLRKEDLDAMREALDVQKKSVGKDTITQELSQQFFASVETVFTQFKGLGYYATLFYREENLLEWRENVDRTFANLYLGTDYWSSAICADKNLKAAAGRGIAYAETPQRLAQVGAHIEATRTQPIQSPAGTEYIYKVTFNIRNGDYENDPRAPREMHINVLLKGAKEVKLFRQDQKINRGSTFGRIGRNAVVKQSTNLYGEVCITFDNIPYRWKIDGKQLCNTIQEISAAPTQISAPAPEAATPTTATPESEFNEI